MASQLCCPTCRSYRIRRLAPRQERWLGSLLALTLVGVPIVRWMGRRAPGAGDVAQCDACVCRFVVGKVRAA